MANPGLESVLSAPARAWARNGVRGLAVLLHEHGWAISKIDEKELRVEHWVEVNNDLHSQESAVEICVNFETGTIHSKAKMAKPGGQKIVGSNARFGVASLVYAQSLRLQTYFRGLRVDLSLDLSRMPSWESRA